jgi:hypothetical protein
MSEADGISTDLHCPVCVAENRQLTGARGEGPADRFFTFQSVTWGVCAVHRTYWYVTVMLGGIPVGAPNGLRHVEAEVISPPANSDALVRIGLSQSDRWCDRGAVSTSHLRPAPSPIPNPAAPR